MKLNKLLAQTPKKGTVIPTGFSQLDSLIGGLHLGEVCTIGARPSMGKTALAMTLAKNIGILNKVPTAVLSTETNETEVARRLVASELGWVDIEELKTWAKEPTDRTKEAIDKLQGIGFQLDDSTTYKKNFFQLMKEAPLWVENTADYSERELIGRIERITRENGIKVLIIDGVERIVATSTSYVEYRSSLCLLMQVARKLNVALLLTCNLTKLVDNRVGSRPILPDLLTNVLETFSSTILFLFRPEYYGIIENEMGNTKDAAEIIVAKNSYGHLGTVQLRFENQARFIERINPQNIEEELLSIEEDIF